MYSIPHTYFARPSGTQRDLMIPHHTQGFRLWIYIEEHSPICIPLTKLAGKFNSFGSALLGTLCADATNKKFQRLSYSLSIRHVVHTKYANDCHIFSPSQDNQEKGEEILCRAMGLGTSVMIIIHNVPLARNGNIQRKCNWVLYRSYLP